MGYTAAGYAAGGSESFHFPDGNASIARLLVRRLVPAAIRGRSAEDVVLRGPITDGWTRTARQCASGWRAPCCGAERRRRGCRGGLPARW